MSHSKIIISDLQTPDENSERLHRKIKAYGQYEWIAKDAWIISTTQSCTEIRDNLSAVLGRHDRIFVGDLTGVAAWQNMICYNERIMHII